MGAFEKRNKRDKLKTLQESGEGGEQEHDGPDGSELDENDAPDTGTLGNAVSCRVLRGKFHEPTRTCKLTTPTSSTTARTKPPNTVAPFITGGSERSLDTDCDNDTDDRSTCFFRNRRATDAVRFQEATFSEAIAEAAPNGQQIG